MKAFGLADKGAPAAVIEVPTPEPGPGEVRVKVRASSVNGFDVFVAKGMARGMMEHRYPVVIGKDHAGEIDALGEGVTGFAVGDEVIGIVPTEPHLWRGAYAEFVAVPLDGFIVHKPGNLDFERAACLGLAALTAFHCVETVEASEGDVELVVGATGGVGAYTVQLAAARGAKVVASALPQDKTWIRGLGADEIVDYSGDVVAAMRGRYPEGVDGLIVAAHVGDGFGALDRPREERREDRLHGRRRRRGSARPTRCRRDEPDRSRRPRDLRASRPDGGGRHAQRPDHEVVHLRRAPAGAPARRGGALARQVRDQDLALTGAV